MSDLKSKLQDPISKQGKALEDKKDMIGTHMKMESSHNSKDGASSSASGNNSSPNSQYQFATRFY